MTRVPSGVSRCSSEASTAAGGAPLSGGCRYQAVIFDLDGTLADTAPLVIGCMLETIRAAGHAVSEEQLLRYIGPPLPVMLKNMLGMELDAAQPLYFDYLERYRTTYMQRTAPLPGALERAFASKRPAVLNVRTTPSASPLTQYAMRVKSGR